MVPALDFINDLIIKEKNVYLLSRFTRASVVHTYAPH